MKRDHKIERDGVFIRVYRGDGREEGKVPVSFGIHLEGKGWLTDSVDLKPEEAEAFAASMVEFAGEVRRIAMKG